MGFSLEDTPEGKRIYSGNKEIGRVCQHADGSWIGVIGKYVMVRGLQSPKQAFNEATSKYLRYDESWKKKKSKHHKPAPTAKKSVQFVKPSNVAPIQIAAARETFTATCAFMRPRS